MKRSWLLAVIVFAAALVLGHFVLAPNYCRGAFEIPLFDRADICLAQTGFTRSASALYYFCTVAFALFVGILVDRRRVATVAEEKKAEADKATPVVVVEPAAVAPLTPSVSPTPVVSPTPSIAPVAVAEAPKPDAVTPAAEPAPIVEAPKVNLADVIEAALKSNEPLPPPAPTPPLPRPAPTPSVAKPPVTASAPLVMPPAPVLPPPPKPTPIPKPWQKPKAFDGTNEELIARFKELTKEGGVEAIATAQRNLDESTLSALAGGTDPKQHLSQIAHLLLIEDPDLKSEVARGVVVHIAARLKELGVSANLTGQAS